MAPEPPADALALGPFLAWVSMDGLRRPVHQVAVSLDKKRVTALIGSESGNDLSVTWVDNCRADSVQSVLEIDGEVCDKCVVLGRCLLPTPETVNTSYVQSFRRTNVSPRKEASCHSDGTETAPRAPGFGTIKLALWCVDVKSISPLSGVLLDSAPRATFVFNYCPIVFCANGMAPVPRKASLQYDSREMDMDSGKSDSDGVLRS